MSETVAGLERLIRGLVEKGQLTHISVASVWGTKPVVWRAQCTLSAATRAQGLGQHEDPVMALCIALENASYKTTRLRSANIQHPVIADKGPKSGSAGAPQTRGLESDRKAMEDLLK